MYISSALSGIRIHLKANPSITGVDTHFHSMQQSEYRKAVVSSMVLHVTAALKLLTTVSSMSCYKIVVHQFRVV